MWTSSRGVFEMGFDRDREQYVHEQKKGTFFSLEFRNYSR